MLGSGGTDFFSIANAQVGEGGFIEAAVLPLRDFVLFPKMVAPLYITRARAIAAIEAAQRERQTVIAVAQIDPALPEPQPEELYGIGTEMAPGRLMRLPDDTASVLAEGRRRVRIVEILSETPYLRARAVPVADENSAPNETEALMRAVVDLFQQCVDLNEDLPEDAGIHVMNVDEPGWLADLIASMLPLSLEVRQTLLETFDVAERLRQVSMILGQEIEVLALEDQIKLQAQQAVDNSQRELLLREKLRVIQHELGETDIFQQEVDELHEKILQARMPEEVHSKALKELSRLSMMPPMSPEVGIVHSYLDWLVELPWWRTSDDNLDIAHAAAILDAEHYGLPKAKARILEHIAVRRLAPSVMRTPILCFVGPPGTGKTSLGKSIAAALGREFVRVSLGGVRDEAEIRGHRRTYIGALPGRIIQTMRRVTTINPVFMMDEIDKLGTDFRGDPAAALLEVLDPEQNHAYSDHYLDVPYDLSKVMFITTANQLDPIPPALRDRLEVIEFPGYTEDEKLAIARQFLVKRQLAQHGLEEDWRPASGPEGRRSPLTFDDDTLLAIIREYTYEAGVRNLEREIANVCRKVARSIAQGERVPRVAPGTLHELIGPPRAQRPDLNGEPDEVGVATGVAWTPAGGDIMAVEVSLMPGKGELLITGQLGDVMRESAQAAMTYTRANAERLGIAPQDFGKYDAHIHVPEGAIHKDGPSAGVTLCTALVSAFTRRKVRRKVAMTGEITLRGRVLPVGGVREKLLTAYRAGVRRMIVPRRNEPDLSEVPPDILARIEVILVDRVDEVLEIALFARPGTRRSARDRAGASPQPGT